LYKLKFDDVAIAESIQPITWVESELAWFVIVDNVPTHYCDSDRKMTVEQVTA